MRTKRFGFLLSVAVILAMVFGFALNVSAFQMGGSIQGTPINVEPALVSTFAGSIGSPGSTDATGTAAKFYYPEGMTNLYVTDSDTIRKIESTNTNGGNNCAATISGPVVHIPILTYSGYNFWVELTYDAATSALLLTNFGLINDMTPYASCAVSSLSSDFKLHIPALLFDSSSYRVDLRYNGSGFVITGAGQTPTGNLLLNPGFESGSVNWTEYASDGYPLITKDPASFNTAHTGSYYAFLGGGNNVSNYIYQDVGIPSDAQQAYLQFWYRINTLETTTSDVYDTMVFEARKPVDNTLLSSFVILSNLDERSGWVPSEQYDLSTFIGQTIRLRFMAITDAYLHTNFRIDDISLSIASSSCTYTISPTSQTFASSGGAGNVTVTASDSSCAWTATSTLSWVTITSGSGTGNGTATFTVSANTSTNQRTGTMTIAGQIFTITQSGITGPSAQALQVFKNSKTANGQNTGGDGKITSAPVGIICGDTCGAYFFAGDRIVLTAVPNAGSTFTGWSGACAGAGSCTVTMDADQSVTANFTKPCAGECGPSTGNVGVLVKVQGVSGSGTVTSNPAGINCEHFLGYSGDHCFAQFAIGFPVILTATPKPGYNFIGWEFSSFATAYDPYPPAKPDCPGTAPCTVLAYPVFLGSTVEAKFQSSAPPPPTPHPYCNVSCSSDCFAPVNYQSYTCAECAAEYNWCVANSCGNRKNILYWNACQ